MVTTALHIEKLVYGGEGLSRDGGQVVLTPFVLPGEEVRIETGEARSGVLRGRAVEILTPSEARIEPRCPYFGRCGGCQYQHATYEAQLEAKRAILTETLRRVGKIEAPAEIATVAAEPWEYRNRAQFHIEDRKLGYRERGSHKLCAIEQCPISSPKINECITILNGMLRDARWPKFIRSIEVFTDEGQVQLNVLESDQPVAVRFFEWAAERIPGLVASSLDYAGYRVSHNSFFQVNRFLIEQMVETALQGGEGARALDLYAGVGLFSLPLARKFESVTAVESGTGAVRDLQFNAERAGVKIEAYAQTVDEYLESRGEAPDFVLADPPRTGLGKHVVRKLIEWQPRAITIVSCDPATLARDMAALEGGGYRVERMTLIDLFPQT
ncbi:MAG: rRNA (uracil-5-)-methyltransferase RumA, partial [Bryobacterales bacterium]|nr:rRNA (uracil-5-)-methyltransferase RumA [Bryobacterales bacterium]